jgi:long-chain fatty acid transport protein
MTGQANFNFPAPFDTDAVDKDVTTKIPLAQVLRLGLAWDVTKELNLSVDLQRQMWSSFQNLSIHFKNSDGTETVQSSARNSTDSWVFGLSGQYKVTDALAIRAAYAFDQHTLPEYTVNPAPPDSDKHVISLGLSYLFGRYGIHAHFADAIFAKRTTFTNSMPGTWVGGYGGGTMAYIFGLSLSAALDVAAPLSPNATAANP